MLKSEAYSIQMSFDVPDSEKRLAERAEELFEDLLARLKIGIEFLTLIYDPFSKQESIDSGTLIKYRKTFREYRNEVKRKYTKLFRRAHQCVVIMNEFNTDTAVEEIMDSFVGMVRDLEKLLDMFLSIFSNIDGKDFKTNLIASIDSIKRQSSKVKQLVNDRILEHIESNILAKNWASDFADKANEKLKDRMPLVVQLFQERQQALQGS